MELMRDDPKFFQLRNRWFYTSQDSPTCPPTVIPLQKANGQPATLLQASSALQAWQPSHTTRSQSEERPQSAAINSLTEALGQLANVVATNAEQIHALSVAQSAGLQHMQEINESNSTQIKAIADSQLKLQALVDQNASHYIALSNTSFQSHEQTRQSQEQTRKSQKQTEKAQEQTRDILKSSMSQLQALTSSQTQLAETCDSMMRSIGSLSTSVPQMNAAMSDTTSQPSELFSAMASRISPPPRKLNRRIKGVWYEYDSPATPSATPRRRIDSVNTPPKSPIIFKNV
jgi:chromosome segregation ATPase